MKAYISAKVVLAEPQPNKLTSEDGYFIRYPDGYESWCPAATFEKAYRELDVHERALVGRAL